MEFPGNMKPSSWGVAQGAFSVVKGFSKYPRLRTTDPRFGFYDLREKDERGGV